MNSVYHNTRSLSSIVFSSCSSMIRMKCPEAISSFISSFFFGPTGKAQFIAKGGKVGRKEGYKKPDEIFQVEYSNVIKQLRKGYPIRMIAKNCGVGISTVQRIKKKFVGE